MGLISLVDAAMRSSDKTRIAKAEAIMSEALEYVKTNDERFYEKLGRELHESLYGPHYTEEMAIKDLESIYYTDSEGLKHKGPHWTKEQVLKATSSLPFPDGTTDCDKYVAFNAAYADFCSAFTEDQIIKIGYLFFFKDEDWNGEGKIWKYMSCNK